MAPRKSACLQAGAAESSAALDGSVGGLGTAALSKVIGSGSGGLGGTTGADGAALHGGADSAQEAKVGRNFNEIKALMEQWFGVSIASCKQAARHLQRCDGASLHQLSRVTSQLLPGCRRSALLWVRLRCWASAMTPRLQPLGCGEPALAPLAVAVALAAAGPLPRMLEATPAAMWTAAMLLRMASCRPMKSGRRLWLRLRGVPAPAAAAAPAVPEPTLRVAPASLIPGWPPECLTAVVAAAAQPVAALQTLEAAAAAAMALALLAPPCLTQVPRRWTAGSAMWMAPMLRRTTRPGLMLCHAASSVASQAALPLSLPTAPCILQLMALETVMCWCPQRICHRSLRHACSLQKAQLAVFQKMQQAGFNQDVHSAGVAAASGPQRASDTVTGAAAPGATAGDTLAGGALAGGINSHAADDSSAATKARSSDAAEPLGTGSSKRGSAAEADSISVDIGDTSVVGGSGAGSAPGLSTDPLQRVSDASAGDRGGVSSVGGVDAGASARGNGHQTTDDVIQQGIANGLIRRHGDAGDADISGRAGSSGGGSGSSSSSGSNEASGSQLTQALGSTARGGAAAGASSGAVDELGTGGDADEDFADRLLARATAAGELFATGGSAASAADADGSRSSGGGSAGGHAGAVEDLPAAELSGTASLSKHEASSDSNLTARAALPDSLAGSAAAQQQQGGQQEQPKQQQLELASSRADTGTGTAGSAIDDGRGSSAADGSSAGGKKQGTDAAVATVSDSSSDSGVAVDALTNHTGGTSGSRGSSSDAMLGLGSGSFAKLSGGVRCIPCASRNAAAASKVHTTMPVATSSMISGSQVCLRLMYAGDKVADGKSAIEARQLISDGGLVGRASGQEQGSWVSRGSSTQAAGAGAGAAALGSQRTNNSAEEGAAAPAAGHEGVQGSVVQESAKAAAALGAAAADKATAGARAAADLVASGAGAAANLATDAASSVQQAVGQVRGSSRSDGTGGSSSGKQQASGKASEAVSGANDPAASASGMAESGGAGRLAADGLAAAERLSQGAATGVDKAAVKDAAVDAVSSGAQAVQDVVSKSAAAALNVLDSVSGTGGSADNSLGSASSGPGSNSSGGSSSSSSSGGGGLTAAGRSATRSDSSKDSKGDSTLQVCHSTVCMQGSALLGFDCRAHMYIVLKYCSYPHEACVPFCSQVIRAPSWVPMLTAWRLAARVHKPQAAMWC